MGTRYLNAIICMLLAITHLHAFRGITQSCSNMLRATTVLQKQWNLARVEITMPPFKFPFQLTRERLTLMEFFSFSNGVGLYNISNRPVTYAKVWKAGNEAIRANLYAEECKSVTRNKRPFAQHEHKTSSDFRRQLRTDFKVDNTDIFTFGREPISHFVSGLAEYYFRCFKARQVSVDAVREVSHCIQCYCLHPRHVGCRLFVICWISRRCL